MRSNKNSGNNITGITARCVCVMSIPVITVFYSYPVCEKHAQTDTQTHGMVLAWRIAVKRGKLLANFFRNRNMMTTCKLRSLVWLENNFYK